MARSAVAGPFRVLEFEARGVVGLPEDWTDEARRVIIDELARLPAAERGDADTVRWRISGRLRRLLRRRVHLNCCEEDRRGRAKLGQHGRGIDRSWAEKERVTGARVPHSHRRADPAAL